MTDAELEQHIQDCTWHMECCYARFEAFGDHADRDAAVQWMHMRDQAMASRSDTAKAAREAEIQRQIDDLDYFQVQGARARVALEGVGS